MGLWSVVTAGLPIPVTYAGAIPAYGAQKALLSTYTSLICFLVLGFVFYSRHMLARAMFPEYFRGGGPVGGRLRAQLRFLGGWTWNQLVALLPLLLILGCAWAVYKYYQVFVVSSGGKASFWLKDANINDIPYGDWLMLYYLLIFLTAELAFALMALKEYLQGILGLSDLDIIRRPSALPRE
jgi:hypothetical protein